MLPQLTRRHSPLRIKNLETDVHNMVQRVYALAEHVVFGDISLTGSNAPISSIVSVSSFPMSAPTNVFVYDRTSQLMSLQCKRPTLQSPGLSTRRRSFP